MATTDVVTMLNRNLELHIFDLHQLDRADEPLGRQSMLRRAFDSGRPEALFPQTMLAVVYAVRGELARAEPVLRRIFRE